MTRISRVQKEGWRSLVPPLSVLDYQLSLVKILNFFVSDVPDEDKKRIAIDLWESQGKTTTGLNKMADVYFQQAGALAWLITEDYPLDDEHIKRLDDIHQSLLQQWARNRTEGPQEAPKQRQAVDHSQKVAELAGEVLSVVDRLFMGDKTAFSFDVAAFLASSGAPTYATKAIAQCLAPTIRDLETALVDEEVRSSYSYLTKWDIKAILKFVQDMQEKIGEVHKVKREARVLPKNPVKQVAAVSLMKDSAEFGIKSIRPEKIVGAVEVYVFNTKTRTFQKYVAKSSTKLAVAGKSIVNYDEEKSGGKKIRKPLDFFRGCDMLTKKVMQNKFTNVASVQTTVSGRLSEDHVLLACF